MGMPGFYDLKISENAKADFPKQDAVYPDPFKAFP
jgi:hypothetical protein